MPQPLSATLPFVTKLAVGREEGAYLGWVDLSSVDWWEERLQPLPDGFDGVSISNPGSCTGGFFDVIAAVYLSLKLPVRFFPFLEPQMRLQSCGLHSFARKNPGAILPPP